MIGRQRPNRYLQKPALLNGLFIVAMLLAAGSSQAQEFQVSASRAIPEVLVYTDTSAYEHPGMSFAVIVDKSRQQVNLYRFDGYWQLVNKWPCSTGKLPGPKMMEGDQRTPEGLYFATRDVGPRFLTATYGARALPLDYPNWLDRHLSRSGSAIWLHGTNKPLQARDSNGCIVLDNQTIERLAPYIRLNRTPVIIVDRLRLWAIKDARQATKAILNTARDWHAALMKGSFSEFSQFYDRHSVPSMRWWQKWCRQRRKGFLKIDYQSAMAQRAIYRSGDLYVLMFDHVLHTASRSHWVGRHKLYLSFDGRAVRIFGDTYQSIPRGHRDPLLHAWRVVQEFGAGQSPVAANEKSGQRNYSIE